jgi:hypothetical protein
MARPVPRQRVDVGLTIAWSVLHPNLPRATEKDYQRNAQLRDQFNASRLQIGTTQLQVESTLKSGALESGVVAAGSFGVYGSNESFNIDPWLHFSNILVVFREGKVSGIYSARPGAEWRDQLGVLFLDLPGK